MPEQRAATYREVFAVAEFRPLFTAHLLSSVGAQFSRVALSYLVFTRTNSPAWTAVTYALTFLPSIVAGPLLSGLADRYPRRRVMVLTDLARAVLVAAMAVPQLSLLAVGVLLIAVQMLAAPFTAARAATLPLIMSGDRFVVANGLFNITFQFSLLAGFAAGGVLTGVDVSLALVLNAATFALSALLVGFGLRPRPAANERGPDGVSWSGQLAAGARLVWGARRLRLLVVMACLSGFYVTTSGLAVPYADAFGGGPRAVGLLLAATPTGAVAGMLVLNLLPPAVRLRLLGVLPFAASLPLVACVLQPGLSVTALLWAASGLAASYQIVANAEFVRLVPDAQRGQAFGLAVTALMVSQGVGVLVTGLAAESVAPAVVIGVAGGLGVAAGLLVCAAWGGVTSSARTPKVPADTIAPADDSSRTALS